MTLLGLLLLVSGLVIVACDSKGNETLVTRMELVPVSHGKYRLEVFDPAGLEGDEVRCSLEGGSLLRSPRVLLERQSSLHWQEHQHAQLQYSLSKDVYKIIVEGEGYISCGAKRGEEWTERKLYRYTDHLFALHILYEHQEIQDIHQLTKTLTTNLNKYISTTYLKIDNIRAIPVRQTNSSNSSLLVVYHVAIQTIAQGFQLPSGPSRGQSYKEYKDWELLLFLASVSSSYLKESKNENQTIEHIRSTRYCHRHIAKARFNGTEKELNWPTSELGQKQVPIELCVDKEGRTIVLECAGDFIVGAYWDYSNMVYECQTPPELTTHLHHILQSVTRTSTILASTLDLLTPSTVLSDADIQYVADIMASTDTDLVHSSDIRVIANLTDSLLRFSEQASGVYPISSLHNASVHPISSLQSAQEQSNSSSLILEALDRILNDVAIEEASQLIVTDRFVTLVVDLAANMNGEDVRGLAALGYGGYFKQSDIVPLTSADSLESLLEMDVALAVLLPPQLLDDTRARRLVVNLFNDDALFGSRQTAGGARRVVSVTLDGKKHRNLDPPLVLVFGDGDQSRNLDNTTRDPPTGSPCVFWQFDASPAGGSWSQAGCTRARPRDSVVRDVCVCTHLTHFGQLLRDYPADLLDYSPDRLALDVITATGCALSLLGLLGIALTACFIPDWTAGASKKIQLNLCAALGLMMLAFLLSSFVKPSSSDISVLASSSCLLSGILLHYSIVASFCWMLVAAWGQYRRLTRPLESLNRRPHFVLKSCLFAWGVPFVPWIAVLIANSHAYNPPNCYPSGGYLYYSVLLPVTLAVSLNGTIFILIMGSIYNCCGLGAGLVHLRNNQSARSKAFRKALTAMFLFVLLGLSWVFGILGWSYLFCGTATLQGLAMFVFFVVLDKRTRAMWAKKVGKKEEDKFRSSSNSDIVRKWPADYKRPSRNNLTRISTISE